MVIAIPNVVLVGFIDTFWKITIKYRFVLGPEGNLVHRCNVCLVYFETKEERDTHWESIHKKEKKFCEICRKPFRDIKTLYSHKRAHENGQILIEQTEEPG